MTRLIELAKKVQMHNDSESLELILHLFEPKIRASLKETSREEQSDLYQELKLRIIEIIRKYDYSQADGFWDFTAKLKEQLELECTGNDTPEKPYEKVLS